MNIYSQWNKKTFVFFLAVIIGTMGMGCTTEGADETDNASHSSGLKKYAIKQSLLADTKDEVDFPIISGDCTPLEPHSFSDVNEEYLISLGNRTIPSPCSFVVTDADEECDLEDTPDFIIHNPYQYVDWEEWGQYKAALHTHTLRSDGEASLADTILDHYNKGFDIVAITDHNLIDSGDWTQGEEALSPEIADAIAGGTYEGPFPGDFIPENPRPAGRPMIAIPYSTEQSRPQHLNTFWVPSDTFESTQELVLQQTLDLGGVAIINHPGRYSSEMAEGAEGLEASRNPLVLARYTELFEMFEADVLLGFEIFGFLDGLSRFDRVLWDQMLMIFMPQGRSILGFANDDSHTLDETGYNWNVMLMETLSEENTREAMEGGVFYMVSRVTRGLGPTEPAIPPYADDFPPRGDSDTIYLLNQTTPSIVSIEVNEMEGSITIEGADYTEIEWIIGDGLIAFEGDSFIIAEHWEYMDYNYVRAQLRSPYGIAMTQAFGVFHIDDVGDGDVDVDDDDVDDDVDVEQDSD